MLPVKVPMPVPMIIRAEAHDLRGHLMRLRDGLTESERDALLAALRTCPSPSIQSGAASCWRDLRLRAGAGHLLLTFDFDSREKLREDKVHPTHIAALGRHVRTPVAEIARVQVGLPLKPQAT
jgi:hypothetical protein